MHGLQNSNITLKRNDKLDGEKYTSMLEGSDKHSIAFHMMNIINEKLWQNQCSLFSMQVFDRSET